MAQILRPVPFLTPYFGHVASNASFYPAPFIDPVSDALTEEPWVYKIRKAFFNDDGDRLFNFGISDWYLIPRRKREAYQLCCTSGSSTSSPDYEVFKEFFMDELSLDTTAILKYEKIKQTETCAIAYIGSFDQPDIRMLTPLSNQETSDLQKDIFARKFSFIGIPDIRDIYSAFQKENGDVLIVSNNKAVNDYEYKTFRMFTGPRLDNLREIPITEVEGYRDGTKIYYTTEGCLFDPAEAYHKLPLQWFPVEEAPAQRLKRIKESQIVEKITDPRIITMARVYGLNNDQSGSLSRLRPALHSP